MTGQNPRIEVAIVGGVFSAAAALRMNIARKKTISSE
jgi:hypothetical protein